MSEDGPTTPAGQPPRADSPTPDAPTPTQLKNALKAFKKRLKLAKLDDESRMGYGATSSGSRSGIVAIIPPQQFPQAVWDELHRQGKIRRAGQGLYELVDVPPSERG